MSDYKLVEFTRNDYSAGIAAIREVKDAAGTDMFPPTFAAPFRLVQIQASFYSQVMNALVQAGIKPSCVKDGTLGPIVRFFFATK